jgi:hypothetical protein
MNTCRKRTCSCCALNYAPKPVCTLLPHLQVLGHTKTILVLLASWWVFQEQMTARKLAGMSLAVAGMVLYGLLGSRSAAKAAAEGSTALKAGGRASAAGRSPNSRRVGKQAVMSDAAGVDGSRVVASHPIRLTDDGSGLFGRAQEEEQLQQLQQQQQYDGSSIAAGVVRRHRAAKA